MRKGKPALADAGIEKTRQGGRAPPAAQKIGSI
jgi:hypothetical protein